MMLCDAGHLFFGANLLAGVSALLATRLAERIGLVCTMVYSHIPSNILLCLVPLMPNFWMAVAVLLLRALSRRWMPFASPTPWPWLHRMNAQPPRGITTVARSVGAALAALGHSSARLTRCCFPPLSSSREG